MYQSSVRLTSTSIWLSNQCLTFDQSVFVRRRRSGEDSQLWPNLINTLLFNLQRKREDVNMNQFIRLKCCWSKAVVGDKGLKGIVRQFQGQGIKKIHKSATQNDLSDFSPVCACLTSPSSLRMRRLNSLPSMHRKSSPGCRMPHLVAMARAVFMLSPVTMRTVIPARWHFLMASGT